MGRGRRVPYPTPTSEAASATGRANRRTDTRCEIDLRSALHRRGLRFRKDHLVCAGTLRVRPDVVFTRQLLAVFVDGCFWHCCPEHGQIPKSNREYWVPKLQANVDRDRLVDQALVSSGWLVIRIWEHMPPEEAAELVHGAWRERAQQRRLR